MTEPEARTYADVEPAESIQAEIARLDELRAEALDLETARRLVASAPMAFAQARFNGWDAIGEVAKLSALSAELGAGADVDVPSSLEELFDLVMELADVEAA